MGLYKRPGSKNWQMRFYYKGKIRTMSARTTKKKVAEKQLEIIKGEINQGKFKLVTKEEQISFEEYSKKFTSWAKTNLKPKSYKRYQVSINQLDPFFGNSKLRDISVKQIEKYRTNRNKVVSKITINRDMACLKCLFSHAIVDGYCDENPVKKIRFYKEPKKALFYLTEDEAKKLLKACDTVAIKTYVLLGLHTGMRVEEMLSLRWTDVNFEDNAIILRDTKKGDDDIVPMNATVVKQLSRLKQKSDYVICKPDGTRYRDIRKAWNRIIKKAKIKNCTPYILRHTFATTLVRHGVDLLTVKELGRWSDLKLVERYAHVSEDYRTRVVNILDERFRGDAKGDAVEENEE